MVKEVKPKGNLVQDSTGLGISVATACDRAAELYRDAVLVAVARESALDQLKSWTTGWKSGLEMPLSKIADRLSDLRVLSVEVIEGEEYITKLAKDTNPVALGMSSLFARWGFELGIGNSFCLPIALGSGNIVVENPFWRLAEPKAELLHRIKRAHRYLVAELSHCGHAGHAPHYWGLLRWQKQPAALPEPKEKVPPVSCGKSITMSPRDHEAQHPPATVQDFLSSKRGIPTTQQVRQLQTKTQKL